MKFAFQFPMRAVNRWDDWIAGHSIGELAAAAENAGDCLRELDLYRPVISAA